MIANKIKSEEFIVIGIRIAKGITLIGLFLFFCLIPSFSQAGNLALTVKKIHLYPLKNVSRFKINPIVKVNNSSVQVLAGRKLPQTSIIINNKEVIPQNDFTSWYYELPVTSTTTKVAITASYRSQAPAENVILNLKKDAVKLSSDAPTIIGIKIDPATKDIILTINDSIGALSYNVYYANSLSSAPGTSPFILAQSNFPVSGTGTTQWRDNGTFTKVHPITGGVSMRFYKLEINRVDKVLPVITIASPKDGAVITD